MKHESFWRRHISASKTGCRKTVFGFFFVLNVIYIIRTGMSVTVLLNNAYLLAGEIDFYETKTASFTLLRNTIDAT